MNYAKLDREISSAFNLSEDSVFIYEVNKHGNLLELVYPDNLNGNLIPVNRKSGAGLTVITGMPRISNDVQGERGFSFFNCLTIKKRNLPIQKMITYPVLMSDGVIAVIEVARRGDSLSNTSNFDRDDLTKIKSILNELPTIYLVKAAS